jgi:hypothetical protein
MLHRNMTPTSSDEPVRLVPVLLEHSANDGRLPMPQVFWSKVYLATDASGWIVEPPRDLVSAVDTMVFKGPQAQQQALTYAYQTFGNARFFPY